MVHVPRLRNAKWKKAFPKINVTSYEIVSNNSPPKFYPPPSPRFTFCGKLTTGSARIQRGDFSQNKEENHVDEVEFQSLVLS